MLRSLLLRSLRNSSARKLVLNIRSFHNWSSRTQQLVRWKVISWNCKGTPAILARRFATAAAHGTHDAHGHDPHSPVQAQGDGHGDERGHDAHGHGHEMWLPKPGEPVGNLFGYPAGQKRPWEDWEFASYAIVIICLGICVLVYFYKEPDSLRVWIKEEIRERREKLAMTGKLVDDESELIDFSRMEKRTAQRDRKVREPGFVTLDDVKEYKERVEREEANKMSQQ